MRELETSLAGTMSTDTQQIARGLRQRDLTVLHILVEQYQYRLVRYLIYFLGRRDLVDDLVQETWLRVLERGHTYKAQSRFEPWLFAIARNIAIDAMRKRRVFTLDVDDLPEQDLKSLSPDSSASSPFEQAARTEDAQRLAQSLQSLEPIYRESLVLRFQEELSLQEIANIVAAPVSTVSTRIRRGLAALRVQMEGGKDAN